MGLSVLMLAGGTERTATDIPMTDLAEKSIEERDCTPINVVVAHGLEAKALLPMLRLRPEKAISEFTQYSNSQGLQLIVSGIGKAAIAKAVRFLAEQQSKDDGRVRGWINIGIAGHRDAALGSGWLANKITDQHSGLNAYPPQLISGLPARSVITVDEPENSYPVDAVYEMEASAFFDEASRHATAELVQAFKIVSDNLENPISRLDMKKIPIWIAQREAEIETLVSSLAELATLHNTSQTIPSLYHEATLKNHLTVNQKLQLKRLCQRYRALGRESELDEHIGSVAGAKSLLAALAAGIDRPEKTR